MGAVWTALFRRDKGSILTRALALALGALAAGCSTTPKPRGLQPVAVPASAETAPVRSGAGDAADDPAIWRDPADPARSLVVATDKQAGLYVYGLDGAIASFTDAGRVNNVDLLDLGSRGIVVVASDRNDPAVARLQVYRLDPATRALLRLGEIVAGPGEAYGVCLGLAGETVIAYSVIKDGTVRAHGFLPGPAGIEPVRLAEPDRKLATQSEGCVVDPLDGALYVGEEGSGVWRFARGAVQGALVARVDNRYLVADVEGLALMRQEGRGWLVVSSQGDNAYAVFSLADMQPRGRFRIAGGAMGSTEETDGIALAGGSFGPAYPGGLFVAQDGRNQPGAQNFKLVSWAAIRAALAIE